ncbi:MAG: TonB-dependent receptor [Bacteroidia bacterium]|nr:TonB-dependent receptor [Bacteroidia bacterium]MBT8275202.1 TonB-dependent receptor [Bacteroidia bacterium]NNF30461.1 TonB-dependent receptor [Flavobacteriaceae bacterium]NNK53913.1 TonB-dependent receptor [Flavobacteriaceae bacterium]NNM07774.1 TonB-dependent receptor [Flavobacteriaceae bacterium]
MKAIIALFCLCLSTITLAQTDISGKVVDQSSEPILGANVIVVGTGTGTATDFDGNFTLRVDQAPPFTVQISSIGFETQTQEITSNNQVLNITLAEGSQLDEVVISASRTPERIFESPVTVERFDIQDIKYAPNADFYDGLEAIKGVDINTNSLTFKSINTRGFATFANERFVQLVDGMDNSSPALNFVLGNLLGMTELDVNSIELLPGASSALYGANAFNGILFMTSKNPFDHQGISAYYKRGMTSQEAAGDNDFYDMGFRAAHAFTDKFAAKVNVSILHGTDWFAVSEEDVLNPGRTRDHPNYDGLNVYGDEVATNLRGVGVSLANMGLIPAGSENLLPSEDVSRTGYNERDLTNYNAESVKFDAALHYRPWADDFEVIYVGKIGVGSTIYQGANRYSVKNFFLQQHKLEFKNDNFFVRGYITDEDAGDSYDMRFTGININNAWKDNNTWFGEYAGAFIQATLAGATPDQAHGIGRQTAETGRLIPGTPEFQAAFDRVTNDPDISTGSQFKDETQLYHVDANYNFSHLLEDIADVQVGGSYRQYRLNSSGTIFTDFDGPISYSEVGAYSQIQKKLVDDRLKLTGSIRYDKSELFDGQFTPRLSVGFTAGEKRNHNFRVSWQTAFRNPTTQDLFIGLDVGRAILVGSAEDNLDRDIRMFPLSGDGQNITGGTTATITARDAYTNSFSVNSVLTGAPEKAIINPIQPEEADVYEVGYRGKLFNFIIDASAYYSQYSNFISNENVIVPLYGTVGDNSLSLLALQNGDTKVYQTYTNSDADVKSYGASIGVSTRVAKKVNLSANYTYADQDFDQEANPDFRTNFNTPMHKAKASVRVTDLFPNFGVGANFRWSDEYFWQAGFADGIVPSFSVLDAQINYKIPKLKTMIKAGASNVLNEEYFTAYGTGNIGAQYYVSLIVNNL